MKSGTTDPFANDDSEDEQSDEPTETEETTSQTDESDSTPTEENHTQASDNTSQFDRSDLPYALRRNKVKDERDDVHQLFVRSETDENEKDARRKLEDQSNEDIYKLDAREAIYLAGMQNLDDAEEILREWGIDI